MFQNHWHWGKERNSNWYRLMQTKWKQGHSLCSSWHCFSLQIWQVLSFPHKLCLALCVDKPFWYNQLTQVHHSRLMLVVWKHITKQRNLHMKKVWSYGSYSQSLIALSLSRNFKALCTNAHLKQSAFTVFKKASCSTTVISKWDHVTKKLNSTH